MTSFLNRLKIRIFVPMNKVTDIDLQWYEAVRQDNYPAFEKLFQKYYDPLCRYAQGLLADGSLAEDVVQDMFIHFWENRIKLQVKDSLLGLLLYLHPPPGPQKSAKTGHCPET